MTIEGDPKRGAEIIDVARKKHKEDEARKALLESRRRIEDPAKQERFVAEQKAREARIAEFYDKKVPKEFKDLFAALVPQASNVLLVGRFNLERSLEALDPEKFPDRRKGITVQYQGVLVKEGKTERKVAFGNPGYVEVTEPDHKYICRIGYSFYRDRSHWYFSFFAGKGEQSYREMMDPQAGRHFETGERGFVTELRYTKPNFYQAVHELREAMIRQQHYFVERPRLSVTF